MPRLIFSRKWPCSIRYQISIRGLQHKINSSRPTLFFFPKSLSFLQKHNWCLFKYIITGLKQKKTEIIIWNVHNPICHLWHNAVYPVCSLILLNTLVHYNLKHLWIGSGRSKLNLDFVQIRRNFVIVYRSSKIRHGWRCIQVISIASMTNLKHSIKNMRATMIKSS